MHILAVAIDKILLIMCYSRCCYTNYCGSKCFCDFRMYTIYHADPRALPPWEMCKDCRWNSCLTLFRNHCHCQRPNHGAAGEVVVYRDDRCKDLVEIRCPNNYLSMQNKKYRRNHSLDECRHWPVYTCRFPHTELEEYIWNIWKGTASPNVPNRTAVSWKLYYFLCMAYVNCQL